jgi:hypothetical protein
MKRIPLFKVITNDHKDRGRDGMLVEHEDVIKGTGHNNSQK